MNTSALHPSSTQPDLLALDVGGANLKAADGSGWSQSEPFAMWREWQRLHEAIGRLLHLRPARHLVVTMTGEIADCFSDRQAGVGHIVTACVQAAAGRSVSFYSLSGELVSAKVAAARPLEVAAANWHALARLAGSLQPQGQGLLLDIGSTTTDIVPLTNGQPTPRGRHDWDRLSAGELVYTGIERTAVPAVVRGLPYGGHRRPISSEYFATTRDAWLLTGGLPECPADCNTADGQPATRAAARIRLARTLLLEPERFGEQAAVEAAEWIVEAQARQLARSLAIVAAASSKPPQFIILSGHGSPLALRALDHLGWSVPVISLPKVLGPAVSRAAPAHAVALIGRGQL